MKRYILYASLLLLTQCSKCKQDDPTPEEQLPPATQSGANTFGCLVNGQPYLPAGYDGASNYAVLYDPGFRGGRLDIRTYCLIKSGATIDQSIIIGGDSIIRAGVYQLSSNGPQGVIFLDENKTLPCSRFAGGSSAIKGSLTITRLDLGTGVIAGTFEFTLAQPGCDTLRVTQGRFDKKL
jgi:hypothetical protein